MTTHHTVADWLRLIDRRYPNATQATWDNSGLQVGDPRWPVARVLVTLDVTLDVLDEAAAVSHTLVVAHHPVLFHPLTRLTTDTPAGLLALTAARKNIAITAVHTNLDVAQDGTSTSQPLAHIVQLQNPEPLTASAATHRDVKLVTFVPDTHLDAVRDALSHAGAGQIGAYSACSFTVAGTGTFRPDVGANPTLATPRETTAAVSEQRLEMVVPRARIAHVVDALTQAHPYEEVAYDLIERIRPAERFGLIGDLPAPTSIGEIAARVTRDLPAPHLRVAGDNDRVVTRVAVCGGAGESLIPHAIAAGAELYVTGDVKHHGAVDALTCGLAVIDAGHHATEHAALDGFAAALRADATRQGLPAPVITSQVNTSPWS